MSLDKIDERIVAALIEDARASYATIGSLVGLSAPAVKRRVDRLQETGAIRGFTARVDPAALGWTTEAYVELFCRALTSPADIRAAVRRYRRLSGHARLPGKRTPCSISRPPTWATSSRWWSGSAPSRLRPARAA